jgi:hypothetical protein
MHTYMLRDALVHKCPCPPYNTHEAQIAQPSSHTRYCPRHLASFRLLDFLLGTILSRKGWRSISPDLGRLVPFRQIGFLEHGSVHLLLATMAGWTLGGRGMVGIWFARKRRLCMVSRIIVIAAWGAQMNVNTYAE